MRQGAEARPAEARGRDRHVVQREAQERGVAALRARCHPLPRNIIHCCGRLRPHYAAEDLLRAAFHGSPKQGAAHELKRAEHV